ncbi:response regulator, partial [bacterium]|nr:response regulator [bacterium]
MPMETILVVEDEEDILELVCFTLEEAGYRVLSANTGTKALELARSHHPDLLILDIMLPGKNGLDVCRTLRQSERTRSMPIIMLTA